MSAALYTCAQPVGSYVRGEAKTDGREGRPKTCAAADKARAEQRACAGKRGNSENGQRREEQVDVLAAGILKIALGHLTNLAENGGGFLQLHLR